MNEFAGVDRVIDDRQVIVASRLARAGLKGTVARITGATEAQCNITTKRGPLGWYAAFYLRRHPVQFTWQAKEVGSEWQQLSAPCRVNDKP